MRIELFGVLASGKTTVATALSRQRHLVLRQERLADRWCLQRWLRGEQVDARLLQLEFYVSWLDDVLSARAEEANPFVLDHSLFGHHQIYTRVMTESGVLSSDEVASLQSVYEALLAHAGPPDMVIFSRTPQREIRDRLQTRNSGRDSPTHWRTIQRYCFLAGAFVEECGLPVLDCTPDALTPGPNGWTLTPAWLSEFDRLVVHANTPATP